MSKPVTQKNPAGGFTLVELVLAMAVFSFMLVIIVQGMINIVRMHNQAIASNMAQDSAQSAMNEIVTAIRNSAGVDWANSDQAGPGGTTRLCLHVADSAERFYWIQTTGGVLVLYRNDNGCSAAVPPGVAVSNSVVNVQDFQVTSTTSANFNRQAVHVSLTVGSSNGTLDTSTSGAGTKCANSISARAFCSVVTLTSGAVPR